MPVSFPLTFTARNLVERTLKLLGVCAQGETPSSAELKDGWVTLNELVDGWATQRLIIYTTARNTALTLVAGTATYTIGPVSADVIAARPVFDPIVSLLIDSVEYGLAPLNDTEYAAASQKSQSGQPYAVHYDHSFGATGAGQIIFYPTPDAAYSVVLYLPQALTAFADLNTDYSFPAGYARALRYNLALELAPEYGKQVDPIIERKALESIRDIKSANLQVDVLQSDYPMRGGRYNILTDC